MSSITFNLWLIGLTCLAATAATDRRLMAPFDAAYHVWAVSAMQTPLRVAQGLAITVNNGRL